MMLAGFDILAVIVLVMLVRERKDILAKPASA